MSYSATVLADNPVGYWRLGESSGTTATDSSPSGVAGTYSGTYTQGATGLLTDDPDTAVTFAGGQVAFTGQTSAGAPLFLGSGTVEAWINTSDTTATYHAIFNKRFAYGMFVNTGLLILFDYGGSANRSSGVTVADGAAHQVALVFDSGVTNGSQFYVDGFPAGNAFTMTVLDQTAEPIIGNDPAGAFSGDIDEVSVYPTKLSAARIAAHYAAGAATSTRPSVRSTGQYVSAANDTSVAVPLPAGWQTGDVCYLFCTSRASGGGLGAAPAGWTAVVPSFDASSNASSHMAVYRRVLQGGDTNPTVTLSSGRLAALSVAVQNVDTSTPEDVASATDVNGAQSASITAPTLTPATVPALLLCGFGYGDPTTANTAQTVTPPGTMTEVGDVCTSQAAATDSGVEVALQGITSVSATGTKTATCSASVNGLGVSVLVRMAVTSVPPSVTAGLFDPELVAAAWY